MVVFSMPALNSSHNNNKIIIILKNSKSSTYFLVINYCLMLYIHTTLPAMSDIIISPI